MRKIRVKQALLATATLVFGTLASINCVTGGIPSVAVDSAQARVGRPLTR